jgi:hypothetical protein
MASLGTADVGAAPTPFAVTTLVLMPAPGALLATNVALIAGGEGGEPVDPKRYLLTGAGWVAIQ